jgi:hypothetical protein
VRDCRRCDELWRLVVCDDGKHLQTLFLMNGSANNLLCIAGGILSIFHGQ